MTVPFLNLKAQHEPLREEFRAAISEVIDNSAFAGGPYVARFEEDFARFCECDHAIGVGSGTDALWLALLALGVGPGDEVITVPNTFIATAEAISYCGAQPVFIDVEEDTYNMDPALIESAITPRTKAIIPIHLFGQPADMDPIMEIARKHNLHVVEDACQAHGARYKGRSVGTIGEAGCFSFYPGKNLGAFGEAGAVITNNADLCRKMQVLRDHGQIRKYHHTMIGWNCRMDGIQGSVLQIKLRQLARGNQLRRAHAAQYRDLLKDVDAIRLPLEAEYAHHVYHLFPIRVKNRDEVMQSLADKGVGTAIHYPVPVHLQEAYRCLGCPEGTFPIAEQCAKEFLSLPMFPELTSEQIAYTANAVVEATLALAPA